MKKIFSSYGISGIYKGQVATLWREATGYGVYFLTYELLMQREMKQKGIRRDQVSPANAVLFGAAAGYAVRIPHVVSDIGLIPDLRHLSPPCSCGQLSIPLT